MRYPKTIKNGSASVTIYRIRHSRSRSGFIFSVAWYDGLGDRRQKQFTKLAKALDAARLKADQLSAGRIEAANAGREDLDELHRARQLAGDLPICAALEELRRAREIVGGGSIIEACRQYALASAPTTSSVNVAEAVRRFITAKKKQGIKTDLCYASPLGKFSDSLGDLPMDAVSKLRIQEFLESIPTASTRNNHRKRIITLFQWCRRENLLSRDRHTEAELTDRSKEEGQKREGITAANFEILVRHVASKAPEALSGLVLGGLCGLRPSEVRQQRWQDLYLDHKDKDGTPDAYLQVSGAKPGTPSRRMVPIGAAAITWLALDSRRDGLVCPDGDEAQKVRKLAKAKKIDMPHNCLRHAFISNRVAAIGSVDRVALEAGNSVAIIFRHYLNMVTKAEANHWFSIACSK